MFRGGFFFPNHYFVFIFLIKESVFSKSKSLSVHIPPSPQTECNQMKLAQSTLAMLPKMPLRTHVFYGKSVLRLRRICFVGCVG